MDSKFQGDIVLVEYALEGLADPFHVLDENEDDAGWLYDLERLAPFQHEIMDLKGVQVHVRRKRTGVGPRVFVTGQSPSCLDTAWALHAAEELNDFDSVLTHTQTQGRGQLRRQWRSPVGNVYAALVLPKPFGPFLDGSSVVIGAGVVECLQAQGVEAKLKWPNDILVGNKKVGGILVEEREGRMIAGIGLNLVSCPAASQLRRDAALEADCLRVPKSQDGPLYVWLHLVDFLQKWYATHLAVASSCRIVSDIERNLAWLGHIVLITNDGPRTYRAQITGLADDGGLLVETHANGNVHRRVLYGGSIMPLAC